MESSDAQPLTCCGGADVSSLATTFVVRVPIWGYKTDGPQGANSKLAGLVNFHRVATSFIIMDLQDAGMHISNESLLIILVVGLVAGWLAGQIVRGTGYGVHGAAILGIVG